MTTTATTRTPRTPALRVHKQSGRCYATFNGTVQWFGHKTDPQTRREFDAHLARWLANGRREPDDTAADASGLTVSDVVDRYLAHLHHLRPAVWFEKNGPRLTRSLDPLLHLYGDTPAAEFGPKALQTVRQSMVAKGKLCREELNCRVGIIKAAFVWAGSEEIIPVMVGHGVKLVGGLHVGDYGVREGKGKRSPVDDAVVEATLPHLHPIAAAVVRLLRLTGARPSELFDLTPADIDRTGEVWFAALVRHKTAKHGHHREVDFGPKAQAVLRPFLDRVPSPAPGRPIFSPAGAVPATNREARESRRIGDRYSAGVLRVAIDRAVTRANLGHAARCYTAFVEQHGDEAGRSLLWEFKVHRVGELRGKRLAALLRKLDAEPVPQWTPYQLRHRCLTEIRRADGREAAAAVGGHAVSKEGRITDGYTRIAVRDLGRAMALKHG